MPQAQILDAPGGFGAQLGQQLGVGLSSGLQESLAQFHKQKQFENSGLPKEWASLDPAIVKELLKEKRQRSLFESLTKSKKSLVPGLESNQFVEDKIEDGGRSLSDDEIIAIGIQDPQLARILQSQKKLEQTEALSRRKETTSIRTEYAKRGSEAKKSLQNKNEMLALIERGDLNNPIVAGIANVLPLNIGQFLLTNDSQLYRSLMFENFGILKSMFPGQIRVKEIELLEDKLAGLEKNDEAKKAILENQIKAAKGDEIKARASAKVEKKFPNVGISEFEQKVEQVAAPELNDLYDEIIKGYEKIADKYQGDFIFLRDPAGNRRRVSKKEEKEALKAGYKRIK